MFTYADRLNMVIEAWQDYRKANRHMNCSDEVRENLFSFIRGNFAQSVMAAEINRLHDIDNIQDNQNDYCRRDNYIMDRRNACAEMMDHATRIWP